MGDIDISTEAVHRRFHGPCSAECGDSRCARARMAKALAADRDEWRARAERAEAVLTQMVDRDNEPCDLDHHGYCQAHLWLDEGRCPVAAAKDLIEEADRG